MPVAVLANTLILMVFAVAAVWLWVDVDLYYQFSQEDGFLEWLTFWAFLVAAVGFLRSALDRRISGTRFPWFAFGLAAFCLLVAFEEISWGQRLFGYQPPEYFLAENYQQELNLHNVLNTDLRMVGLQLIVFGYGVALSLLLLVPRAAEILARLGVVASPPSLVPAFVGIGVVYAIYPADFTGEWVEASLGLAFICVSVMAFDGNSIRHAGRLVTPTITAVLATVATTVAIAAVSLSPSDRAATAAREVGLLASDFAGPKLHTPCGIHKRLYTFMREYNQPFLVRGEFANQVRESGAPSRAEFLLDPWNSPYWIRHRCDQGRAVAFVYSFGPNRRRDSSEWALAGDDVGAFFIGP